MARQWGVREPNSFPVVCGGCGKTFYTRDYRRKYCTDVCSKRAFEARHPANRLVHETIRKRRMTPESGSPSMFRWDPDDCEDYDRIDEMWIEDWAPLVIKQLRHGVIVWAKFAELSPPTTPFKSAIVRLERAVEFEREKAAAKRHRKQNRASRINNFE